ncbi:MAG: stage II sporulation protein P, partial [Lachnospiraceae bacterium]|nr:stage II sporulation protein P [Lachnospiraceae bacterium]
VLIEQAAETFLTGFAYVESGEGGSVFEWVAKTAMEMMPLGTYIEGKLTSYTDVEDMETIQMILANQANDENMVDENGKLVKEDGKEEPVIQTSAPQIDTSMEKLMNYEYLLGTFYTVDSSTMADPELLNAQVLLEKNMKIDQSKKGPKVLIYHTHSQEAFADSVPGDESTTIVGMGNLLTDLLNDTYKIETIHHKGVYDMVDGKLDRSMAYDLAEPEIQKILNDNPSIEVVIDLHRDGVGEQTHLVTEINGKQTAQIMFFNGMSRTKANGNIGYLANPYIQDNLAFSLQMQLAALEKYPGFTRHIYLKGYRYNMHFKPKCLLIEAGAQTNTVEEMRNAVTLLADVLDSVITE